MAKYDFKGIEKKWQEKWKEDGLYEPNLEKAKKPFYNLMMFPYPSAEGLHVGNMYAFTGTDVYGRMKRMEGNDVFEPIGLDGFGIHSENYAMKIGAHPMTQAKKSEERFYKQLEMIGNGFAWNKRLETYNPNYYRWTQWVFIQLWKQGLVYRKKQAVNWCPSCKTVLSDEQAEGGKCERCSSEVEKKELEQWSFRITKYADRLLKNLDTIDWTEKVKIAQRNWIGKSEGAMLTFRIADTDEAVQVFTTRPDTLFGATYLVLSPEHKLISNFKFQISNLGEVEEYIQKTKTKTQEERIQNKEKTGVPLEGISAINPATGQYIPVWISDYVLGGYGTGAIMAVPAHDDRDFAFAKKFNLSIKQVVAPFLKTTEGNDAVKNDKKTEKRNTAYAFVKHWKEDKYLCLNWPKYNWHSSVIGGINDGESAIEAGLREIKEETGYKNIKLITVLNTEIHSYYYAGHKEVNRYSIGYCGLYQLVDDEHEEPNPEDTKNHEIIWIDGKKMMDFLNLNNNILMWEMLMSGNDCFSGGGILINSGEFDGLTSDEAKIKITEKVGGKLETQFRLRDWLISRQRYWGAPIPMVFCETCAKENKGEQKEMPGWYAVPEKELPVTLPFVENFRPEGTGVSPLASVKEFYETKCPHCGGKARRETDVSDTFLDSSWYFIGYLIQNPKLEIGNSQFSKIAKKWCPVDMYIGGAEHSVLHLLYVRFVTMALCDAGFLDFEEPFPKFRAHGLLIKEGAKMSKSKGNVINPDEYIERFGADALRMYLMFLAPFEQGGDFRDSGILGVVRFLERVGKFFDEKKSFRKKDEKFLEVLRHKTIKKVSEDIENLHYNTAISALMIFLNGLEATQEDISKETVESFLKLLAPFAPHITEEFWHTLGNAKSIHSSEWPTYAEKMLKEETFQLVIQVNGKHRGTIEAEMGISQTQAEELAMQNENVKTATSGKTKKVIFVPNKLINFVVE